MNDRIVLAKKGRLQPHIYDFTNVLDVLRKTLLAARKMQTMRKEEEIQDRPLHRHEFDMLVIAYADGKLMLAAQDMIKFIEHLNSQSPGNDISLGDDRRTIDGQLV